MPRKASDLPLPEPPGQIEAADRQQPQRPDIPEVQTGPRPIHDLVMELVPVDVEFDDVHTVDATRVNEIHRALYGRDSIYWEPT